jgi:outer membrane biosynthesis protein TonB
MPSISPPVMDPSAARALIAANQELGFDPPPIAVASAGDETVDDKPPTTPKGGAKAKSPPPTDEGKPSGDATDGQSKTDEPPATPAVEGE